MSILPALEAGETLVWMGRPRSLRRLVMRTVPKALFGLAFLAFTIRWMAMVVQGGGKTGTRGGRSSPSSPTTS